VAKAKETLKKVRMRAMTVQSKFSADKILGQLKRSKSPLSFILIILVILLAAGAVAWVVFFTSSPPVDTDKITVTVPWNAGSMADLTIRALTDKQVNNISGSNSAVGINEVYASSKDGLNVLGTNLSSIILSNLTGFTETGGEDWEFWFVAFSPCVAAVRSDSEITSLDDLISAGELTASNAGGGTMSYIAAHIVAERHNITMEHRDHPGINPAINDVLEGTADLIIAPRSDIIAALNSGELREIETDRLLDTAFGSWGEWYALMLPKETREDILEFYDEYWSEAASREEFTSFLTENGLLPVHPDLQNRKANKDIAIIMAEMIEMELVDSGYLRK